MGQLDDDILLFADEDAADEPAGPGELGDDDTSGRPWKILIVDDEKEVHDVTRLALDEVVFAGRSLEFLSAFSGKEARHMVREHGDIALILLDVVMETDHAGLELVRFVREDIGNRFVRIILRTGQPGQAPEHRVIVEYDINDYKAKTELTQQRLFTMIYTSLSSYRDLVALEVNRRGLEKIIDASASIFDLHSVEHFSLGVLEQLAEILYLSDGNEPPPASGIAVERREGGLQVVAGLGRYRTLQGLLADSTLSVDALGRVDAALRERTNLIGADYFIGYIGNGTDPDSILYITGDEPFTVPDLQLIELFCRNVAIARENIALKRDSEETQREIVYLLSEAIERRSNETGNHVRRVGEYSRLLGRLAGLPAEEAEILFMAAPLHDAGKIAIPDAILNKPGRHTPEETMIMRTHAVHGAEMLSGYRRRPVLRAAAIIAGQHHERWDGAGYPSGLAGAEIHIYGRIAALADVFDALGSDRCYKHAWDLESILELLREERGKHFDPMLVDIFLANLSEFLAIRDRYRDVAVAALDS